MKNDGTFLQVLHLIEWKVKFSVKEKNLQIFEKKIKLERR